ncbi:MAG: hypothetical protein E7618_03010 [Ruminococcaceae bacterium]|nr:hypothetical protein [Oscillospiraceae bacterium]
MKSAAVFSSSPRYDTLWSMPMDCCAFLPVLYGKRALFLWLEVIAMSEQKLTKEDCLCLLRKKADALRSMGDSRYPKRSDFSEREVVAIKAFLGPWPRALEAAGLKEPRDNSEHLQKTKEKRIRAKRHRLAIRKAKEAEARLVPPSPTAGEDNRPSVKNSSK